MDKLFLAGRMVIYIVAIPFAAWAGGAFDPQTGELTINLYDIWQEVSVAVMAQASAWFGGRAVKSKGGAT